MTNKEKLKSVIEEDIDEKKYYNEIIKKIEQKEKIKRNNIWKYSLVSICLVAIISGIIFINLKNDNIVLNENSNVEIKLNINNLDKVGASMLDIDVKEIQTKGSNASWLDVLKNDIIIPKDLTKFNSYSIYVRKDKMSEYNILNSYVYNYSNENKDKSIRIAFSSINKPIRDYYFSDKESNITNINGTELKIFKYNTLYFTEFSYKGYNFDIETNNISEKELYKLLLSIIK